MNTQMIGEGDKETNKWRETKETEAASRPASPLDHRVRQPLADEDSALERPQQR